MSLTQSEILQQFDALKATLRTMEQTRPAWEKPLQGKRIILMGCGSSYTLCVSAMWMLQLRGIPAFALPAGDYIAQPEIYRQLMAGSVLVCPSRSGKTSECVRAMALAAKEGVPCVVLVSDADSPMAREAAACVALPFAFDHSVCQTRNVSCFYAAFAYMAGALAGDDALLRDLAATVEELPALFAASRPALERLARSRAWDRVFVLADGPVAGLGQEAALAFCEIARLPAEHKHVLDVRHGPMVLAREKSLVLMVSAKEQNPLLPALVEDFKGNAHNSAVLIVAPHAEADMGEDLRIPIAAGRDMICAGLPMLAAVQWLALCAAGTRGFDPDAPEGLSAWIQL